MLDRDDGVPGAVWKHLHFASGADEQPSQTHRSCNLCRRHVNLAAGGSRRWRHRRLSDGRHGTAYGDRRDAGTLASVLWIVIISGFRIVEPSCVTTMPSAARVAVVVVVVILCLRVAVVNHEAPHDALHDVVANR